MFFNIYAKLKEVFGITMIEISNGINKKVIFYVQLVTIVSILLLTPLSNCSALTKLNQYKNIPHLFAYSENYIQGYLNKAGYSDYKFNIMRRNSIGTNLYLLISKNNARDAELLLSISIDGEIRELNDGILMTRRNL